MSTLRWSKPSYSDSGGGECVEVAVRPGAAVHVRDSKDPHGPHLLFGPAAWSSFVGFAAEEPAPNS